MSETENDDKKTTLLLGQKNWTEWFARFKNLCHIKGWLDSEGSYSTDTAKVTELKLWVNKNIHDKAISELDCSLAPFEMIQALQKAFGAGYFTVKEQISLLRKNIVFPPQDNPAEVFRWLSSKVRVIEGAGGSVSNDNLMEILLEGLTNSIENDPKEFYKLCKSHIVMNATVINSPKKMQDYIQAYWNSMVDDGIKYAILNNKNVIDNSYVPSANFVKKRNAGKGGKAQKHCNSCASNGRPERVIKSHNESDCKWVDKVASNANEVKPVIAAAAENKNGKLYFDSACTPTSFVKEMPLNFKAKKGVVSTASGAKITTLGSGKVKFGELTVDATYVPSFSKNLISGIDIMNNGYATGIKDDKIIIASDIIIQDKDKVFATGRLSNGLLALDSKIDPSTINQFFCKNQFALLTEDEEPDHGNEENEISKPLRVDMDTMHKRLGHIGKDAVRRTIEATDGITLTHLSQQTSCDDCIRGKMRKLNTHKKSRPRKLMEVIAGDEQGPFRLPSHEGTKYNVKFVEKFSGYMKIFHVKDIKDQTLLAEFRPWLTRMENRTGRTAKYFECDQSFDGEFLDYLEEKGITKLKGEEYDHHFPGIVENANYNITRHASAMLIASKLPKNFYSEAQSTACYLHNRTVHGSRKLTPVEMAWDTKPNLKHLHPFGCHGFVLIKKEHRNHRLKLGKLEARAVRCRLLGYGDDDETEEMAGYKVLVTHDWDDMPLTEPYIINCKQCTFDESKPMSPISANIEHAPYTIDDDVLDDVFSEYEPSLLGSSSSDENSSQENHQHESASNESQAGHQNESASEESTTHNNDSNDSNPPDDDTEDDFIALSAEEINEMTNVVKELYKDWFDSEQSCGMDPETLMYAFVAMTDGIATPLTYKQAMSGPESVKWKAAMDSEYDKLQKLGTYKLEHVDNKANIIKCRWVYKKKLDVKGRVTEYKARLCAKGFTQRYGIDFYETFAPVAKIKSIRALAQISASEGLIMYQDDVPSAFVRANLLEVAIMDQIPGYDDGTGRYCVLQKTLYGLKQSPREWNKVIDGYLKNEGFKPIHADNCIYIKRLEKEIILVAVYVDDIITCGKKNSVAVQTFRDSMHEHFKMKPGGILELYLGCYFQFHSDGSITMDQNHYLKRKLEEFSNYVGLGSRSCPLPTNYQELLDDQSEPDIVPSSVFPYREMVGSLMYAMVSTRPDLAQSLSIVSRYLSKPNVNHCNLVRHIFQYVKGNLEKELVFKPKDLILTGYVDAAYGNNFKCASTSGYCFLLGNTIVSWYSKAQAVTALSAAEAEYIAATEATKEAIWWRQFLDELGYPQETTTLNEDNQACILLSKNPQSHSRTKHIQIRYHFIREKTDSKEVSLQYVNTKDQLADMFTKNLPGCHLRPTLNSLGCIRSEVKGRIRN